MQVMIQLFLILFRVIWPTQNEGIHYLAGIFLGGCTLLLLAKDRLAWHLNHIEERVHLMHVLVPWCRILWELLWKRCKVCLRALTVSSKSFH